MMASLSSSSPGKPLRLKDFLKEDPNSDSCGGAGGFRAAPRRLPDKSVRHLLAVELADSSTGDRSLQRFRSKGALTKINAVIHAVKMLPFAASPSSPGCGHSCVKPLPKQGRFLSRSFSRKLRPSFWRKRGENGEHRVESTAVRTIVRVKDIVRLRSFGDDRRGAEPMAKTGPLSPPSTVRSTHSGSTSSSGGGGGGDGAWSDTESAGSDSFSCGSSVCCGELKDVSPNVEANCCSSPRSPYKPTRLVGGDSIAKSTCYLEPKTKEEENGGGKEVLGCPCHFEEEKDQLSPVSVMDFPFEEDDNDEDEGSVGDVDPARTAASPTSFHRSLANLERTKHQLLQKLREFESLAALVSPVDLDSRFASAEDENEPDRAVHEGDGGAGEAGDRLLQFHVEVEERAFTLLRELQCRGGKAIRGGTVDELLVDFFIERLSCPRRDDGGGVGSRMKKLRLRRAAEQEEEEEALLRAAADWIVGRPRGEQAKGWEAEVREMEMEGRWRCAHVEEEEITGDLGDRVIESLVDELLADLVFYE